MVVFKKNGELNISKLSEYMGFSPQKLKSDSRKVKTALLTEDAKEKYKRQYDALVLGGLAMYAGLTQDGLIAMIKENSINKEVNAEILKLKDTFKKVESLVKSYDNKYETLKELQNAVLQLQDLSDGLLINIEKLDIEE